LGLRLLSELSESDPKDAQALERTAQEVGYDPQAVASAGLIHYSIGRRPANPA